MPVVLNQINYLVDLMSRSSQHGEMHWSANERKNNVIIRETGAWFYVLDSNILYWLLIDTVANIVHNRNQNKTIDNKMQEGRLEV